MTGFCMHDVRLDMRDRKNVRVVSGEGKGRGSGHAEGRFVMGHVEQIKWQI